MIPLLLSAIVLFGCESHPRATTDNERVAAANAFTDQYAKSRLARWNLKARAAGPDCSVLLVDTSLILEDSLIEALHYGAGAYAVQEGGVQGFCRQRTFRAAVYHDRSGRMWTFGDVQPSEAPGLKPCR
jgi:hypothetical protein